MAQVSPVSKYEYVTVVFDDAGVDLAIDHALNPSQPDLVDYEVVQRDRPCQVYHDATATRRVWTTGQVSLRCDTAGAKVTLRLTLATDAPVRSGETAPYVAASAAAVVDDTAYGVSWDAVTDVAPSKNAVYDKIEALPVGGSWTEQTTALTGAQHNFNLNDTLTYLRCTGAAPVFSGFTVAGAAPTAGCQVLIACIGTTTKVTQQDAGSTAANRIITPSTAGQIIGASGLMLLVYDDTTARWREALLDPGAAIVVPHAAGDYTAPSPMTVTIDAGDLLCYTYRQIGATLEVSITIGSGSLGGTASYEVRAALPNGFVLATGTRYSICYLYNNSTNLTGYVAQVSGVTYMAFRRLDGANFTLDTNLLYIGFSGLLPIA